jgi:hypothetical protein
MNELPLRFEDSHSFARKARSRFFDSAEVRFAQNDRKMGHGQL